jgi:hypothetical protein
MEYYFTANNYGDRYLQEVNGNSFNKLGAHVFLSEHFDKILLKKEQLYIVAGSDSGQLPQYLLKRGIPAESEYIFIETHELYDTINEVFPDHPQLHLCHEHNWKQEVEAQDFPLHVQSHSAMLIRSIGVSYGYYTGYTPLFETLNEYYHAASVEATANSNPFHFYKVGFTNLAENQYNISALEDQFEGKTAILLGAAPSLDQHIEWIQQNQQHLYIFTVSRLAHKLHELGITPHFIVTVDPDKGSFYIGKEAFKFEQQSILIHSYHGNPELVSQWGGGQLFTGYRYPWKTDQNDDGSEQTGSTVSNAALDAAITMGFSQIVLAGIDFCFDSKGFTHASDTGTASSQAPMVAADASERQVINNMGETVETTFAFSIAGKEFSRTASNHCKPHQTISNLSGSALQMRGVKYIPKEQITIDTISTISFPKIPETSTLDYYQTCQKELKQVNAQLIQMNKLCKAIVDENKKLFNKNGEKSVKVEGKILKIEKNIDKKYKALLHLIKRMGQREILKHLHATRKDQELWTHKEVTSSSTSYYQILRKSIKILQSTIKDAMQRVESRNRELSPDLKSLSTLVQQWENDNQPRRAQFWKQRHNALYEQLSSEEQRKIEEMSEAFVHSFESNVEQMVESNVIHEALLNIINLANNRNKTKLEQLINKLAQHPDQESAPLYIALCDALIAELKERDTDAFTTYATLLSHQEKLTEEVLKFILERVSTTSIRLKDYNNAIFALQTLSEVYDSDYHTPIYAELLYLTGNAAPAIETFEKHLKKSPNDLKSMFRLAELQLKEERHEIAKGLYQHILDQDNTYLPAQHRLNEISKAVTTER